MELFTTLLRVEIAANLIYEDDDDRKICLGVLAEVVERFNWNCFAYCLNDEPLSPSDR